MITTQPFSVQTQERVSFAADLVRRARGTVVLSGAGISTPSGIPDFRSAGTGLWARDEPMEVASLSTFRTAPERFFAWFRPLAARIYHAQPNAAHSAIAELEQSGRVRAVITQNIDALHHKAGSKHVVEMHGTLRTITCVECYTKGGSSEYLEAFVEHGIIPRCPRCHGIMKPDVILFGEQLPQGAWREAVAEARTCDVMLVVGSSLEVLPVAGLPLQALERGAHLIIVNNTSTYVSVRADVALLEDVALVLPSIAQQALHG